MIYDRFLFYDIYVFIKFGKVCMEILILVLILLF